MIDYRLPYFYHLALTAMFGVFAFGQIRSIFDTLLDPGTRAVMVCSAIPALFAGVYFLRRYQSRSDLSVREALFALFAVQIVTQAIFWFLRLG